MPEVVIRKRVTVVEENLHEGGPPPAQPLLRGAALVVIRNPFAGRYVEDIAGFMDDLKPLGVAMAKGLLQALAAILRASKATARARSVGARRTGAWRAVACAGRLRHARDSRRGQGHRAVGEEGRRAGTRLDVPVTHINASYVRSHFDAMEIGINDAPRADEMLLALVMTTGARVHARVGGLKASEIKGQDGLR